MKTTKILIFAMVMTSMSLSCTKQGSTASEGTVEYQAPATLSVICDSAKTTAHMTAHPERWQAAFKFIAESREKGVEAGTYQLLPDDEVFAIVSEYEPRDADSCRFEAHRKYIDLQYIAAGREVMGITTPDGLTVVEPYVDDIEFYDTAGVEANYATADAGSYFTFFPDDPHRPSIKDDTATDSTVKKIVVKIKY